VDVEDAQRRHSMYSMVARRELRHPVSRQVVREPAPGRKDPAWAGSDDVVASWNPTYLISQHHQRCCEIAVAAVQELEC
jgi:hypothetical protein